MILRNNKQFELPQLMGGSFSGLDRLEIPYDILILRKVSQREDNGDIQLFCQAKDGPEQKNGGVSFIADDRKKKDELFRWFQLQIGKDIKTIYESDFKFEGEIQ